MDLKKIYIRGLAVTFLLLILIVGILFIPYDKNRHIIDENSLSLSFPEDNYEPNNDYGSAYNITSNERNWLSLFNGTGTQWDDDWYMIYVNPGYEHLRIILTFNHFEGDIDLQLYDSSFTWSVSRTSVTDDEFMDVIVPIFGVYYIQVYYGNMGNIYDLWYSTSSILDDSYEENDQEYETYDLSSFASITQYNLRQFDDDWYQIQLDPGEERLRAELYFNHFAGNIDFEVYDWNFNFIDGRYSTNDNEFLEFDLFPSGTYYLKVIGDNTGNTYDLYWEDLIPIGSPDDSMEENDDFWSSIGIIPDYYPDLKIFYGDEDWFHLYLNPGDNIDVSIYFNHMEGNLQLELYDPSNMLRLGSYSRNNDESLSFTADIAGDWRIRVYHANGDSEVLYHLDIWLNAGGPGDDWMEENDGFWSSSWVDPNYYHGLKIVYDDEDWFQTYLDFEDIFDVRIYFDNKEGNLELELYDPHGAHRIGSYSENHYESLTYKADVSGNWRIRVYHKFGDSEAHYDLEIRIKDDFYEFNNDPYIIHKDHPSSLAEYEQTWLSDHFGIAVQGDEDWYIIDVTPGFEHLIIELKFTHTLGNIDLDVYDEWGYWITGNNSNTDDEYIDFRLPHPGVYGLRVYGSNWGNKYDMWWDDLKTDLRLDDYYEVNNDPLSAYDISYSQEISLWDLHGLALQFDEDWYEIYIDGSNLDLIVWLAYDSAEGLMGFEIYNHALTKITGNFTLTDNDFIVHEVSNGTYYIRVFGDNSGNVYNLWWNTIEPKKTEMIPGYDLLILIASIIGVSTIALNLKRSKLNHK